MNIFSTIKHALVEALPGLFPEMDSLPLHAITTEPPKDSSHGDISTNVAMVLAKPLKQAPMAIAEKCVPILEAHPWVASVAVAKPGFINLTLKKDVWHDVIRTILKEKDAFGNSTLGKGEAINVEYVSINPTGPMHVGHVRGAVYGDSLARLLVKAGYDVTKEYYYNDAGGQIDVLARSSYMRYLEANGQQITIPEGLYPGDYLIPVGEALKETYGATYVGSEESEWLPVIRPFAVKMMMDLIQKDLDGLGVSHDVFTSEQAIHDRDMITKGLERLQSLGHVYRGVLEAPKGKVPEDWEPREQLLFKSTDFGDDVDRPLQKSNGAWTYFAADVGYTLDKIERNFNQLVCVLGADHGGYIKRLKAVSLALSEGKVPYDVKIVQIVHLFDGGEPLKMSKRAGRFVTLQDVLSHVGKDALRFMMLTRKNDASMEFDLEKVKEETKDNPIFYVQYAHARACSVMRHANDMYPDWETRIGGAKLELLTDESEHDIMRLLASWPRMVEAAAEHHEPHRIIFYLQELAAAFHSLWNKGRDVPTLRFLDENQEDLSVSRLAILKSVVYVIASGLALCDITPRETM